MTIYYVSEPAFPSTDSTGRTPVEVYTQVQDSPAADVLAGLRGDGARILIFETMDELVGVQATDPNATAAMLSTLEVSLATSPDLLTEIVEDVQSLWDDLEIAAGTRVPSDPVPESADLGSLQQAIESLLLYGEDPVLPKLLRLARKGLES